MIGGDVLLNELTERIIGAGIEVHKNLGPGLLESVYHQCVMVELRHSHLRVERERHVPLKYKGEHIQGTLKIDLIVEGKVVVEIKAIDRLHPIHQAQVVTYLKLTGCPAGLLMNFNSVVLTAGLKRLNHPELHVKKFFS